MGFGKQMASEVNGSGGSVEGGMTQVACGAARSGGAITTLVCIGAALVRQEAAHGRDGSAGAACTGGGGDE
ncbi:hypothetical protein U1Q18_013779 [Sarracenia purpurea var. burkii]